MSNHDDEVIDLNAGDETLDNNEFEINLEIPKADSKKRKLSETIESGERDTSEIEHVRKSPKNNLDQANEWFTSFFNAPDDSSSQPERTAVANATTNVNSNKNSSSTNNNATPSTVTAESPRISTKHLASPVPPKTSVNTTPTTPASAKNTTPIPIAKQPISAPIKIAVQPTVLPPNASTTSVPLPATVVARVPSSPKQSYRFAITQQGIVVAQPVPVVSAATPTVLGGRPAPQIAPKTPLVQPVQQPAPQPTSTTNTATPAIAKADPKVGLVFRLQDTVTALAVVQKALEQKKASLVPTSISTLTAIAPKPSATTATTATTTATTVPATANRPSTTGATTTTSSSNTLNKSATAPRAPTPAPPKASTTPTTTSTPAVRVPLHIPKQTTSTATTVPPKPATTSATNTPSSIRTSTNGSTTSASAPQARSNMPSPTILRRSGTGQAPTQRISPQTTPAQSPQSVPRAASSQPQTTQISHPLPSRPASQTPQAVPTRATPSPQPQVRATTSLAPSPSVSPAPHQGAVPPQRTVTPPQRTITPPQQPPVPVVSYNNQYNAQPAQPTGNGGTYVPYYNYQEQYQRLMRQYPNQYTTSSQPSLGTTAQPTYNTGQMQQYSSQPNPQAQYSHLYQTQTASYSHSLNQAQYSAQSISPHQAQYATQPVPAQYSHSHEQYSSQHSLQPQYTYSSQPNVQSSHSASQPSSLRVSVNPAQGTAALRTSQSQYPPHTVEVPSTEQSSSYLNSFGSAYQQQQPYQYQAYSQRLPEQYVPDGADYMPLDLTNNIEAYNTGLVSSQYNSQSYDSGQTQYNLPVQTTLSQQANTTAHNTSASTADTMHAEVAPIQTTRAATHEQPGSNVNSNQQALPQPATTPPKTTKSAEEVDSKPATTTVETARQSTSASPPELISNSDSASQDDVIFVGTNRKPEKPMRRSVALPPRRLVPSSASNQTTTPTNNNSTGTSNTEKNPNTSTIVNTNTDTTLALITKPVEAPATSNNNVAEPMQVDSEQPNQQQGESSTVVTTTTEPRPELNNESDNSSQVNSNADRDRCMMISTARFLRRSGEVNDNNNGGTQNNNPMYIDVPDADQSEVNRLKPNTRRRRQIYRTDEYWSYWSAASQSQQSQEYGQDEQSNRSPERDNNSPVHSPGDLGQLTQQYTEPQTAPEIQIERQQGQVAQQTSNNNNLAKSSEFGLTNFELDEQSYMPTTSPPVPRLRALPNNNNNVDSTVPSTSPRQHVQPNPGGFSTDTSEGNIHVSSNSTSLRIIGPLDRYFRVSPEKVQNAPTTAQQQQHTTMPSYTNERDVITINDSQEDPTARANNNNNNNFSHNTNQWNDNYYAGQDGQAMSVPPVNTTLPTNVVVNNNYNSNNTNVANNTNATQQQQVFLASRSRTPDNLRQSNNAEKKANDGSKAQQKVLLPYIASGPLVLTRIEPPPAWHGGLLWPGLGTIKQQYMELFIPNDPRVQSIPYITELPKLLMAREMSICDSQTMPTGHFCIQLVSPVLDKHSLPKAFWDPNFKAFWALKMHYNNLMLCVGPKMLERKTILCLYITVQGPTPRQQQPITCALSNVPADMMNFFQGLNLEHYYHEFLRNGITSLYALCQITREQMVTIITNETELNVVLNELRKLVMEAATNTNATSNNNVARSHSDYNNNNDSA